MGRGHQLVGGSRRYRRQLERISLGSPLARAHWSPLRLILIDRGRAWGRELSWLVVDLVKGSVVRLLRLLRLDKTAGEV